MARLEGVRIWETRPFRARYETAAFGVEWKERENKRAGRDWRRHGTGSASMVRKQKLCLVSNFSSVLNMALAEASEARKARLLALKARKDGYVVLWVVLCMF